MRLYPYALTLLLLLAALCGHAQLTVQTQNNALLLARKLVGDGVVVQNATYQGGSASAGFFTNAGGNQLGLDSGLVLTNGRADDIIPSGTGFASNNLGLPGDALLSQLVQRTTADATVLEFDFVPLGDSIRFRYVFSSEEYNGYTCSEFNDVFAFMLSGPGISGTINLALVPGTNIPVAINSINDGHPTQFALANCSAMGPGSPFTRLYVNNLNNATFSHDGHTVVLEAKSRVQPCQTYHLRLVIADAGGTPGNPDRVYDSGVFLEARSFSASGLSLVNLGPTDNGQPYLAEGCRSGAFGVRSSSRLPVAQPAQLLVTGTATNGVDVTTVPTSVTIPAGDSAVVVPLSAFADGVPEGTEMLKIYLGATCPNVWADSLLIAIREVDTLALQPASPYVFCGAGASLPLQATPGYSTYQWQSAAPLSGAANTQAFVQAQDSVTVLCTATEGSCIHRDSVLLLQKKLWLRATRDVSCSGHNDGEIRLGTNGRWWGTLLFQADNRGWSTDSNLYFLPPGTHTVYLRDATGCTDSLRVTLGQKPDPHFRIEVQDVPCPGVEGQIRLFPSDGTAPYVWSINGLADASATVFDRPPGTYHVLLKDFYQCTAETTVVIGVSPPPQVQISVDPARCLTDGRIHVSGTAGLEYSFNFGPYESGVSGFDAPPGPASLRVRNHPACVQLFNPVVPLQSDLQWTLRHFDTLCFADSLRMLLTSNAVSYSWTGPALSDNAAASPMAAPGQTTLYYVAARRGNCSITDSVELFVRPLPVAGAGNDTALCQGDRIRLQGSGGVRYAWQPAAGLSNPQAPDPQLRPSASTSYWTNVTDQYGCVSANTDTVQIRVVPTLRPFAGRDTVVTLGQPLQLLAVDGANAGVTHYQWSPGTWLSNDTLPNPVALIGADITYQVLLRTPEGCSGSAQVSVKLYRDADIYVPTAFTPNGDGRNDRLRAIPIGMRSFGYFRVYNRWGTLVFETRDPKLGWDGRVNGQLQDSNVYVWIAEAVDYKGQPVLRKGTVVVVH